MIVVFGGTGTLGHALAKIFTKEKKQVTIISRCELKQKNMAKLYPNFRYIVGDVRDDHWKRMVKPSIVYNLAAMKHVDTAEFNTEFCYDVNVNGTINTLNWALDHDAKYMFSGTDKGVLPINAYGASKMMAEKIIRSKNETVCRWGNVANSRGSVIGLFKDTLINEKKVYITDIKMTRFFIHIDEAAEFFVQKSRCDPGLYIPGMGAAKIVDVAYAVAKHCGIDKFEIIETGIRPGEKIHEVLDSNHTSCYRSDDKVIRMSEEPLFELVSRSLDEN